MQQKLSSGSVPWAYVGCSQGTVRRCQNSRPWSACSILMAILYSGKTLLGFTKTKTLERGFLVLRGRWLWTQKLLWGKLPSVVPTEMLMVGTTSRPVLQGSQHRWHHGKHHHSTAKSLPNVVQGLGSRENAVLSAHPWGKTISSQPLSWQQERQSATARSDGKFLVITSLWCHSDGSREGHHHRGSLVVMPNCAQWAWGDEKLIHSELVKR